jgi:hypothetical protein
VPRPSPGGIGHRGDDQRRKWEQPDDERDRQVAGARDHYHEQQKAGGQWPKPTDRERDRGQHERRGQEPRVELEPGDDGVMVVACRVEQASSHPPVEQLPPDAVEQADVPRAGQDLAPQQRIQQVHRPGEQEQRAGENGAVAAGPSVRWPPELPGQGRQQEQACLLAEHGQAETQTAAHMGGQARAGESTKTKAASRNGVAILSRYTARWNVSAIGESENNRTAAAAAARRRPTRRASTYNRPQLTSCRTKTNSRPAATALGARANARVAAV